MRLQAICFAEIWMIAMLTTEEWTDVPFFGPQISTDEFTVYYDTDTD